jgi:hypothetical protein
MWARAAGLIYLFIVIAGGYAQLGVRDALIVAGDAAATAAKILENEALYRFGFAVEVFYLLLGIPLKYFLFRIFGVVNRGMAIVMVLFAALGAAIQAVILLGHYAPLLFLKSKHLEEAFTVAQRESLALLSLQFFDYGYMIALSFFGCFCLVIGSLITRQRFFPRFVGWLLMLEGVAYLTNSFGHFISPALGAKIFPFLLVSGVAELSFCLALLIAGVNEARWREHAGLAASAV